MSIPKDSLGKMADTKWHIGYVTKDPDDPRRDKRRCIYFREGNCAYGAPCFGSSHCSKYRESSDHNSDIAIYTVRVRLLGRHIKKPKNKTKRKESTPILP